MILRCGITTGHRRRRRRRLGSSSVEDEVFAGEVVEHYALCSPLGTTRHGTRLFRNGTSKRREFFCDVIGSKTCVSVL